MTSDLPKGADRSISWRLFRHAELAGAPSFALGDLVFEGDKATVSSADRDPDQSMMIYLAIPDLVQAVLDVQGGMGRSEFVGPDSSFSLVFHRVSNNKVRVLHEGQVPAEASMQELVTALRQGIESFLADPSNELAEREPAHEDVAWALGLLRAAQV